MIMIRNYIEFRRWIKSMRNAGICDMECPNFFEYVYHTLKSRYHKRKAMREFYDDDDIF